MVRLDNVSKSFGDKQVLKNINLSINLGEVTFIVGSSGAGKSTLLNLIGGLDTATSGHIFYNDKDISENICEYRAKKVGFIFQDYNLIAGLSVKQNVELGLLYAQKERADVELQLAKVGIKDDKQSVETMSGGEKQRVAIIRSICKDSELIIADEPTGNLDSQNANMVFELLVNMKSGRHVVIVSHDLEMAHKYGDRIITLSDGMIVEDKKVNSANIKEMVLKKSVSSGARNFFKAIRMVGFNSLKRQKNKIISIALVFGLVISMVALLLDFNKLGNEVSENVNVNYLESDLISVFYPRTANLAYKETPFSQEEVDYISTKYNVREIVQIYTEGYNWLFSYESNICEGSIKQINLNDFFKERIMSYDIEGNFPKNKDEIILAKDVAEALFNGNCIGKEITINDGTGESVVVKIVGINRTANPFDEIYSIVSSEKIKELYDEVMQKSLYDRMELCRYEDKVDDASIVVRTGGVYGAMSEITDDDVCIVGDVSGDKNGIIVSSALIPYVIEKFEVPYDNVDKNITEEMIEELAGKKLVLKYNGINEVYITGVYQSENIEMKLHSELVEEMKNINPRVLEIYVSPNVKVSTIRDKITEEEAFTCHLQLENLKISIVQQTGYFKLALIVLGVIMIFASIAMLASFSKIVVLERRKEIAILKSLGAADKSIVFTLWFDAVTISLLAYVFALIMTRICVAILPTLIKDMSFVKFNYPIVSLTGLGILFMFFVCIYTLFSMQKLVRKMPAELFKQ